MHWIRPLSELTLTDISQVGGKAAHLGALLRAGFPVPPGFVIEVSAFMDHFGQTTDPLVRPPVPRLQAELMAEVVQATIEYLGEEAELAVRSSSTDEDGDEASFAGLHSTYYFVTPNRLDQAILDCWMSLWSAAALAYRRQGWTEISSGEPVRMAIIVQQMLPATRSGVVFSKDPIKTNNTDVVIEAAWGLGAALVDGRVSPDHIRLSDSAELLNYQVADKRFQVSAAKSNRQASRLQEVATEQRNLPVLTETEAEYIANISLQLETLFDQPQDIEWAYVDSEPYTPAAKTAPETARSGTSSITVAEQNNDANLANKFYILQSRPITSLTSTHHIKERLVLFKPLAENFTEPLTPMTEDIFSKIVPSIGAMFEGRFYIDVDKIAPFIPFAQADEELVDLLLLRKSGATSEKTKLEWSGLRLLKLAGLGIFTMLTEGANWLRTSRLELSELEGFRSVAEQVLQNKNIDAPTAMKKLMLGSLPFESIQHQIFFTNVSAGRYFLLIALLEKYVARHAPDYDLNKLSLTYHGSRTMHSVTLVNRLNYLAQLFHQIDHNGSDQPMPEALDKNQTPEAESQMGSIQSESLKPDLNFGNTQTDAKKAAQLAFQQWLDNGILPQPGIFAQEFENLLHEYGHRGPREMELAAPRWRETPTSVIKLLMSQHDIDEQTSHAAQQKVYGQHLSARDEFKSASLALATQGLQHPHRENWLLHRTA